MQVLSLNRGRAQTLVTAQGSVPSSIRKRAVSTELLVGPEGLEGDEQADLSVHGGPSKAVYAYPSEHYPFWATVRAQAGLAAWDAGLPWGAMGENLSLQGLLETQVWQGDRLCFEGGLELVVSEPRQPCFKFNAVMGFNTAARLMATQARCGFYLAVAQPGTLVAGEPFTVVAGRRALSIQQAIMGKLAKHLR